MSAEVDVIAYWVSFEVRAGQTMSAAIESPVPILLPATAFTQAGAWQQELPQTGLSAP
jgi:hypothetical protein